MTFEERKQNVNAISDLLIEDMKGMIEMAKVNPAPDQKKYYLEAIEKEIAIFSEINAMLR